MNIKDLKISANIFLISFTSKNSLQRMVLLISISLLYEKQLHRSTRSAFRRIIVIRHVIVIDKI